MKKKKETKAKLKKQVKLYKFVSWTNICVSFIALFFLFYMVIYLPQKTYSNVINDIEFEGDFSKGNMDYIYGILNEVKPEYLQTIKSFKVVPYIDGLYGYNRNGDIVIEYIGDRDFMKEIICHEILHNIINKFTPESFVYDFESTGICYKN